MSHINRINEHIQNQLRLSSLYNTTAIEAAGWLDVAGLLKDRPDRKGAPLRKLLRLGVIKGSRQESNRHWFIDHVIEE